MTSLNEKQVIPTPKYTLRRWLPVAVAVLVLVAAVLGVRSRLPAAPSHLPSAVVPSTVSTTVSTAFPTHTTASPSASATTQPSTATGQTAPSTSTFTSASNSTFTVLPTADTTSAPSTTTGTLPLATTTGTLPLVTTTTVTLPSSSATTVTTTVPTSTSTTTTTTSIGPFDEKKHPSPFVEPLIGMRFYATPIQDEPYRDEVQDYYLELYDFYFFTYGNRTNMFVHVGLLHAASDYAPRYARIEINCYDENDELVTKFTILADEARPGVKKYYKWPFDYSVYQRIARMELATDNYPEGYTIDNFYLYYP